MPQSEADATICAGEVLNFHGKTLRNSGIYTDTLQTADGCDSLVLLRLTVSKQGFYAPNVFSPDSTNDNAVFRIVGGPAMDHISVLRIYDRWGTLVFEEKNELQGWDGTRYGEACPPGVYVWYCEAICKNGAMLTQGGDVLLVR
jgi:gliding motility-associated-like protein